MSFDTLGLPEPLLRALATAGYAAPTEVQAAAIPAALAGRDLRVSSRTGSGKTASFMLPALARVLAARAVAAAASPTGRGTRPARNGSPRVLVLAPTRELAQQVARAAQDYGRHVPYLTVATVVGGVPYGLQQRMLGATPDIVVATPGRLLDHLGARVTRLDAVELLVLDEADRMLDLGFIDDLRTIAAATPAARQTVMFSATFDGHAGHLAAELLRDPERIDVAHHTEAHADIEQRLHWADDRRHQQALLEHILAAREIEQALVFTGTQIDAERVAAQLAEIGHAVEALHGGLPQGRRNRVLQAMRNRRLRVLVATDVAARGLDVPSISHVINLGLPMKAEDYVHRIGRTGRAGRTGLAVTLAERRDFGQLQRIQRFTTQRIAASIVPGLEPQRAEPRPAPAHAAPGGHPARTGRTDRRGGPGRPSGHARGAKAGHPGAPRASHPGPRGRAGERRG
jgi:superfamily II DNA/RNA helicase